MYRHFAIAAIGLYRESFPEEGAVLGWLLEPRPRHSLLTELGRIAKPRSGPGESLQWDAHDVSRLIEAAFLVAERKPLTKDGVAIIRELRRAA